MSANIGAAVETDLLRPGTPPAETPRRRPGPELSIVLVALLALGFGVAATRGLWGGLGTRMVGSDLADSIHYSWWLGHTPHVLAHGESPLQTSDLNWRTGVSAMNSTSLLLPALLLAPLTWAASSLTTLNVLNVLAVPACAAGAYWALRTLPARPDRSRIGAPAALIGAAAFAISPAVVNSLFAHITMAFAPGLPILVALGIAAWSPARSVWIGPALGLTAGAQLFIGEEVLFQAILALVFILVTAALSRPAAVPAAARRLTTSLTLALAVFVPITAYPLWIQFFGPLKEHGSPFGTGFSADLTAFTTPTAQTLLHTAGQAAAATRFHGGIEEHLAYLGWPLLITCVLTLLIGYRRPVIRCAGIGMLLAVTLSLGTRIYVHGNPTSVTGPYALLSRLPVWESSLATRFALLVALFAAALLALAVDGLSTAGARSGRGLLGSLTAAGLGLLCLVPLVPGALPVVPAPTVPAYFTSTARHLPDHEVVLVLPYPSEGSLPIAMRWQSAAHYRFRMPGGYFLGPDLDGHAYVDGHTVSATGDLLASVVRTGRPATPTTGRRAQAAADLSAWGATQVVLGPSPADAALIRTVTGLLGTEPRETGGVEVWTVTPPAR